MIYIYHYQDKYYTKLNYSVSTINGKPLSEYTQGANSWYVLTEEPTIIEFIHRPADQIKEYRLLDKYIGLPEEEYPRVVSLEHAMNIFDDSSDNYKPNVNELGTFYAPVLIEQSDIRSSLPFSILECANKPVSIPQYVNIKFPYTVAFQEYLQHQYPCYINSDDLFRFVTAAINKKIKGDSRFIALDYTNIHCYTLKFIAKLPKSLQFTENVRYYPSANSKKQKTKEVKHVDKEIEILKVHSASSTYRSQSILVDKLEADCVADLLKVIDDYISQFTNYIEGLKETHVCDKCGGKGVCVEEIQL